jgi:hypothetical protein
VASQLLHIAGNVATEKLAIAAKATTNVESFNITDATIRPIFALGNAISGTTTDVTGPEVPLDPVRSIMTDVTDDEPVKVTALAINVTIPEALRWTDSRRGQTFLLTTLNVRLLPDGELAVKAYGRPTEGGRGTYVAFAVPDDPALTALVEAAATRAASLWAVHGGRR